MEIKYFLIIFCAFVFSAAAHNISDPSLRVNKFKIKKTANEKYEFEFGVKNTFLDKLVIPSDANIVKKAFLFNSFGSEIRIATLGAAKAGWRGAFDGILSGWNWFWVEGRFEDDVFISYKFKGPAEIKNPDSEKEIRIFENSEVKMELVKSQFTNGVAIFKFSVLKESPTGLLNDSVYAVISNNFGSKVFHSETILDSGRKQLEVKVPHGITDSGLYRVWIVVPKENGNSVYGFKFNLQTRR